MKKQGFYTIPDKMLGVPVWAMTADDVSLDELKLMLAMSANDKIIALHVRAGLRDASYVERLMRGLEEKGCVSRCDDGTYDVNENRIQS